MYVSSGLSAVVLITVVVAISASCDSDRPAILSIPHHPGRPLWAVASLTCEIDQVVFFFNEDWLSCLNLCLDLKTCPSPSI